MGVIANTNLRVAQSSFGRYFKLAGSGVEKERTNTSFFGEIRAGAATWVTMAYIVAVNALVVSLSGGPCECDASLGACPNTDYLACVEVVRRDLITGTAAICAISCVLMGSIANLPLALAPGLGGSAYFTYTVVGVYGARNVSYKTAMAALFLEGLIFMFISVLGIRQWLARHIPMSIRIASGAGIGLFLTFIGLQHSAGIGLVSYNPATLVELGGCPLSDLTDSNLCTARQMRGPTTWLGIMGVFLIIVLTAFRVKGSILYGVLLVGFISWFRGTDFTAFPDTPSGNNRYEYFKKGVDLHLIEKTGAAYDWDFSNGEVWSALGMSRTHRGGNVQENEMCFVQLTSHAPSANPLVTFLFVDIMDTTGTLYSMARFGGFLDEDGDFEGSYPAFIVDAFCITVGTFFGNPPATVYIESGAGIQEGGKTGITAITTGLLFLLTLFFAPVFASFPPWASGPALIAVGSFMISSVREINWDYFGDSVPAFVTIALMPLTYSIAWGLIFGICTYIILNLLIFFIEKLSFGRLKVDQSKREQWKIDSDGGTFFLPDWFVRKYKPDVYEAKMSKKAQRKEAAKLQREMDHETVDVKVIKEEEALGHRIVAADE
ncbi:hypothetical protein HK104_003486 [Borealophlyctis nickersoniae]|nr:hypothetical protein HK104_003486 [Borealophlyctis nickersoniae]